MAALKLFGTSWIVLCAAAAGGCEVAQAPTLQAVEPPSGLNDRPNVVALVGEGLELTTRERDDAVVQEPWTGRIGPLPLQRITWRSAQRIEVTIPTGIPPGPHDVSIRSGSREAKLARAYTAVIPVAPRIDGADPAEISSAGDPVRIWGMGLYRESQVFLRGVLVPAEHRDDQTLIVSVPAGQPGPAPLRIVTPLGWAERDALLVYRGAM